ncbi:hypothetical protein IGI37_000964 [Enterococcus sp. AZ194]|uniref:lanthionine synthetase LanC family protein n=1 Tax=Enterococcus sp. AZ194 TaxID=2774629 RepID=UPI003F27DD81
MPGIKVGIKTVGFLDDLQLNYLSWCYGTLSIFNAIKYSTKVYDNKETANWLKELANQFYQQEEIECRDMNFCHGLVGSSYILEKNELVSSKKLNKIRKKMNDYISNFDIINSDILGIYNHIDGFISIIILNLFKYQNEEDKKLLEEMYLI